MAIANTLKDYLQQHHIRYEVIPHSRTLSSMRTAEAAHVPGDRLAKTVVLEDDRGYVLLVMPATHYLRVDTLNAHLHRKLRFAPEEEIGKLFGDCALGAIPPVGAAYGIETLMDDSLTDGAEVYFEAGDHEALIHVDRDQFAGMMQGATHGRFSHHL